MATVASAFPFRERRPDLLSGTPRAHPIDRWIYVFMARGVNCGLHKRMMFLATAVPLPAAIDRMTWLPNTLPASPIGTDLWILAALSPLFLWDAVRNRRVHEAYLVWLAIYVPVALV